MESFPLEKYGLNSADALHAQIEAKKLAYADLVRYIGDPKFSKLPVATLLTPKSLQLRTARSRSIRRRPTAAWRPARCRPEETPSI